MEICRSEEQIPQPVEIPENRWNAKEPLEAPRLLRADAKITCLSGSDINH
jgi:hypothetical protein